MHWMRISKDPSRLGAVYSPCGVMVPLSKSVNSYRRAHGSSPLKRTENIWFSPGFIIVVCASAVMLPSIDSPPLLSVPVGLRFIAFALSCSIRCGMHNRHTLKKMNLQSIHLLFHMAAAVGYFPKKQRAHPYSIGYSNSISLLHKQHKTALEVFVQIWYTI